MSRLSGKVCVITGAAGGIGSATAASSVTSTARARSPGESSRRSTPTTIAPSWEKRSAVAEPMPPAAPVMTQTLPE